MPDSAMLLEHAHCLWGHAVAMGIGADVRCVGELGHLIAEDKVLRLYDDGECLVVTSIDDRALKLPWWRVWGPEGEAR